MRGAIQCQGATQPKFKCAKKFGHYASPPENIDAIVLPMSKSLEIEMASLNNNTAMVVPHSSSETGAVFCDKNRSYYDVYLSIHAHSDCCSVIRKLVFGHRPVSVAQKGVPHELVLWMNET